MLRVLLFFGILTSASAAEDRWVYMRSDGFEVFTDAGARAGRAALVRLEQFRYALGRILGKTELAIKPPAQAYVFKAANDAARYAAGVTGRALRSPDSLIITSVP